MSERRCPSCGNRVSDTALSCEWCGSDLKPIIPHADDANIYSQDDQEPFYGQYAYDKTPVQQPPVYERTDTKPVAGAGWDRSDERPPTSPYVKPRKRYGALIACLAALVLAGLGALLFLTGPKSYTVSYETGGGDRIEAQKVKEGEQVFTPADPKRDGYVFAGWYTSNAYDEPVTFPFEVTEDCVLYAKWEKASGESTGSAPEDTTTTEEPSDSAPEDTTASEQPPEDEGAQDAGFVGITRAWASSTLPTDETNRGPYDAACVLDGDPTTAWVEGSSGSGAGESITLSGPMQTISGFSIRSGYHKFSSVGNDLYYYNARPARIRVMAGGETIHQQTLDDAGHSTQRVVFDEPVETDAITIVIDSVYTGECDDCAISEISCF